MRNRGPFFKLGDRGEGAADEVLSTHSVGMNLARRFNRGPHAGSPRGVAEPGSRDSRSCRVATIEFPGVSRVATRRKKFRFAFPGLEKAGLNSDRRYASKVVVPRFPKVSRTEIQCLTER
jgi:hypothetical protein